MRINVEPPKRPPQPEPNQSPRAIAAPPLRPTTIFEPEDPTLDPSAIAHSQPPPERLLPGMLSLGIYGALFLGWAFLATLIDRNSPTGRIGPDRTVDVLLEPEAAHKQAPDAKEELPVKVRGTLGSLDSKSIAPETDVPNTTLANLHRTDFVLYANPSLVPAPGDAGPSAGQGAGTLARGVASPGKALDYELIATHQVELFYQLSPGQTQSPCVIVVAIQIEADGRVSRASAISGPTYLYPAAESAARRWTFEPLSAHGLRAPYRIKISFHYKM